MSILGLDLRKRSHGLVRATAHHSFPNKAYVNEYSKRVKTEPYCSSVWLEADNV